MSRARQSPSLSDELPQESSRNRIRFRCHDADSPAFTRKIYIANGCLLAWTKSTVAKPAWSGVTPHSEEAKTRSRRDHLGGRIEHGARTCRAYRFHLISKGFRGKKRFSETYGSHGETTSESLQRLLKGKVCLSIRARCERITPTPERSVSESMDTSPFSLKVVCVPHRFQPLVSPSAQVEQMR
jgi:hypothetical protein